MLDLAHFVVIARPGTAIEAALSRNPELRPRVTPPSMEPAREGTTGIFVVEATTRDVSSTMIRERLAAGQSIDDLVPSAVARHIVAHHLYEVEDELHGEDEDRQRLAVKKAAGPEKSKSRSDRNRWYGDRAEGQNAEAAKAAEGGGQRHPRGPRPKGRRHRRPRPAESRRLHRLFRDLHRYEPEADSRHRRWRRRPRSEATSENGPHWRKASTSIGMDPARLFRFHRARLQSRVPHVLRSGTALGERGALRHCRRVVDALLAVTIAPRCAACDRVLDAPLAGPVCDGCWSQVRLLAAPFCRTCGDPLPSWRVISAALEQCPRCRRAPSSVDAARAAGHYEGTLREILHAFKYDGRRRLARPLSALMIEAGAHFLDGRRLGRTGAAPSVAARTEWLQPGRRAGAAPGCADATRPLARARHGTADCAGCDERGAGTSMAPSGSRRFSRPVGAGNGSKAERSS